MDFTEAVRVPGTDLVLTLRQVFGMAAAWLSGTAMVVVASEASISVEDAERCIRLAIGRM